MSAVYAGGWGAPLRSSRPVVSVCGVDYDALAKGDEAQVLDLLAIVLAMDVPETLGKTAADVMAFVREAKATMRANPYHNACHVLDVTQCLYTLLESTRARRSLAPVEAAAAIVAAICHDLDHPGLSNAWQNAEGTALSVKYAGESPLEHHHLDRFRDLERKHALLAELSDGDRRRFHEIVAAMILATDMARHGALLAGIAGKLEDETFDPVGDAAGVTTVLALALKCSDVSNQVRPWPVATKWNAAVYEEFYAEGDLDAAAGRDVMPLLDRRSNDVAKSTVGFVAAVVKPLFRVFADVAHRIKALHGTADPRVVEDCLLRLDDNARRYAAAPLAPP